jgi:hypothetical protein
MPTGQWVSLNELPDFLRDEEHDGWQLKQIDHEGDTVWMYPPKVETVAASPAKAKRKVRKVRKIRAVKETPLKKIIKKRPGRTAY